VASRYGPEIIERVRQANDIVAVVSDYVRLKRARHDYKGLCPFHSEKSPSFMVSPDKQLFYCFGCAAGGNVINFIMRVENLSFGEAVENLARRAGVEISALDDDSPAEKARRAERERLYGITELAARFYHQVLLTTKAGHAGRTYLQSRGVSEETLKRFRLGFAPNMWDGLTKFLRERGVKFEDAATAGLVTARKDGNGYFDRFRNRLIFPITDSTGRPIAFGGRVVDKRDEPKYLNSAETPIFRKGFNLFGLHASKETIKKRGHALIVEGYMDAVMCHQNGFNQAVASLGTSLTPGQARLLARFTTEARIAYDADSAGQAATWRGLDVLSEAGFRVRVVQMPVGEDPDSCIRKSGAESFEKAVGEALALHDFKLQNTLTRFDISTTEGRVAASAAIVPLLAGIPGLVERAEYQKQAANMLGVPAEVLEAELAAVEGRQTLDRNIFPSPNYNKAGTNRLKPGERQAAPEMERDLIRVLLAHSWLLERFMAAVGLAEITDASLREIAATMLEVKTQGDEITPASISSRLASEELAQCLSQLALQKDEHIARLSPEEFLQQYARASLSRRLQDLAGRIERVTISGDLGSLNNLLVEYKLLRDHGHLNQLPAPHKKGGRP
jgi:DNA primase